MRGRLAQVLSGVALADIPGYAEACEDADQLVRSAASPTSTLSEAAASVVDGWGQGYWTKPCWHLRETVQCFGVGYRPRFAMCRPCFARHAVDGLGDDACNVCGRESSYRLNVHTVFRAVGPVVVLFVFCDNHIEASGDETCCAWPQHLRVTLRTACTDRPRF